jgi:hypothetical protein
VQFADDEEVTATVSRLFGARGILHPAPQAGNTLKHKKDTHLGALFVFGGVLIKKMPAVFILQFAIS